MSAATSFGCTLRPDGFRCLKSKRVGDCSTSLRAGSKSTRQLSLRGKVRPRPVCTRITANLLDDSFKPPGLFGPTGVPLGAPDEMFGLSTKQMSLMGLSGEEVDGVNKSNGVTAEVICAKNNYRREVPSMNAIQTTMSGGTVPGQAPPDLPSLLLNSRIVYLGMPLVPAVTELLIAELLFLGYDADTKPIYVYINSTGSQTQDGEAVGFETEAYAIMDTMQYIKPPIHTVCVGKAWGNAAMLLASGVKGHRHALPHSSIMTCPPRMNRAQDCASNLMIKANELASNTDTYVDFLTDFSGKDREEIKKDVGRTRWFTPEDAIEYGLIDKVIKDGEEIEMEKKDYEMMLKVQQAQAQSRPGAMAQGRQ